MSDTYRGMEYLGPDNTRLQEDPVTGKAFHIADQVDSGRPSLEWHPPSSGAPRTGLGGTQIDMPPQHTQMAHRAPERSPAQLMIDADEMEQQFMNDKHRAENPYGSSVEGSIDRSSGQPPDWLHEYMDSQKPTEMTPTGPSQVDIVNSNKYLSEREKLKYLKFMKDNGTL